MKRILYEMGSLILDRGLLQKAFMFEPPFGQKKFGSEKNWVRMKILGTKIIFGYKKVLGSKKILGIKNHFGPQNNLKKFLGPKNFFWF